MRIIGFYNPRIVDWTSTPKVGSAVVCWFSIFIFGCTLATQGLAGDNTVAYQPGRLLGLLADKRINESSGIAPSQRVPGILWTHNDSGNANDLFAITMRGRTAAVVHTPTDTASDWEDMASVVRDNVPYLVVGDVGDNNPGRDQYAIHVFVEPDLSLLNGPSELAPIHTLRFRYAAGFRDCEAMAVDPVSGDLLLLTKQRSGPSELYCVPWSTLCKPPADIVVLEAPIAKAPILLATALDIARDGQRIFVGTYGKGFMYRRLSTWAETFKRTPTTIKLPPRLQGEAACFAQKGYTLYLTSEKRPTPLWELSHKEN